MKKSFLLLIIVLCIFSAVYADEDPLAKYRTGTPWLNSEIEGIVTEDTEVDLKDDFALAINKEHYIRDEIIPSQGIGGTIAKVVNAQKSDTYVLFGSYKGEMTHEIELALKLYQLALDWESRDALGVQPLLDDIAPLKLVTGVEELNNYFLSHKYEELSASLFLPEVSADFRNPGYYIMALGATPLTLEDAAEYHEPTEYGEVMKKADSDLVRKILNKAGISQDEIERIISNSFTWETMVSETMLTEVDRESPDYTSRIMNYYSEDEVAEMQGALPIVQCLRYWYGVKAFPEVMVCEPAWLNRLSKLYIDGNIQLITDWMIFNLTMHDAERMDRECLNWYYESQSEIIGSNAVIPDEQYAANLVSEMLPWSVSRMYVESYTTESAKETINGLIDEIIETYRGMLAGEDFLTESTREKAIEKLDAMKRRVLYPDDWSKYSAGELDFAGPGEGGSLIGAIRAISGYEIKKIGEEYLLPIDTEKWSEGIFPTTVNCFYDPSNNSINILAAFARYDIYNPEMSREEVMAKLGTVIGHEISHGFDASGSQFDKNGAVKNWWTEEDKKVFDEKVEKLAVYIEAIHPWEGFTFDGRTKVMEAGADMAGMHVILECAKKYDDFDYDQFFRAYADFWARKLTLKRALYYAQQDSHPLMYLRVNMNLQQFDEFLDTFDIKPGDGMYLAPEDRVLIW